MSPLCPTWPDALQPLLLADSYRSPRLRRCTHCASPAPTRLDRCGDWPLDRPPFTAELTLHAPLSPPAPCRATRLASSDPPTTCRQPHQTLAGCLSYSSMEFLCSRYAYMCTPRPLSRPRTCQRASRMNHGHSRRYIYTCGVPFRDGAYLDIMLYLDASRVVRSITVLLAIAGDRGSWAVLRLFC